MCYDKFGGVVLANTNQTHTGAQQPAPRRKKRKKRNPVLHVLAVIGKVLGTLLLIGVTTGAIMACFAVTYINQVIVPKADLNLYDFSVDMSLSSTMYYTDKSTGSPVELRSIYGTENRVWVKYEDLPQNLVNATIAIEDHRFRSHHGVDWIRTAKGILSMFTGGDIQGGSTITQQLIKNLTDDDEVTVQRKILEIFRALEFEKKYDKNTILEWYLNYIYLGEHCNGVYTASYAYFGKDVSQLSLAECASLISITNNPSVYNPYATRPDKPTWGRDNNTFRAKLTIGRMLEEEMISQEEYDQAKAELDAGLNYVRGQDEEREETVYTWYEDQVISDVIRDLMEQKDYSEKMATDLIYYGGLKIETCIDPEIQAIVDEVYQNFDNLPYISGSGQQLQSAIVIVDPSGNIVALSGGMGEKESSRVWSRATDTKRAPGSSFKPLSVYARAIDIGLISPGSVYDDSPYQAPSYPSNSYLRYYGRMTVRDALTISSNTVAIKVLAELTPDESFNYLTTQLGFTEGESLIREQVHSNGKISTDIALAPLSMGGLTKGVSVREMATAYSTFPRGGTYLDSRTYTRVLDNKGNVILDNTDRMPTTAMKDTTAWYMNSMLKDVVSTKRVNGSIATGYQAVLDNMTVAGKTGSTDQNKDRWFVGYTPYYTAAVWTGYDQQERVKTESGSNPAAVMWKKVMSQVHEGLENKDFPKPDGLVAVKTCAESGMLLSDACYMDPRGVQVDTEYYFPGDAPTQYCTMHNQTPFPEGGLVKVCLDDPFLDAKGNPTGMYHLAGEFCPEDRCSTVSVLDFERQRVSDSYSIGDDIFTKEYLVNAGEGAYCTVHTEPIPYDPGIFNPDDTSTWPTEQQWPGFDPEDMVTWPNFVPPMAYDPNTFDQFEPSTWPTQEQWPGFDISNPLTWPSTTQTPPTDTPAPEPSEPGGVEPTPPAVPTDEPDTPPDEPFVPAA